MTGLAVFAAAAFTIVIGVWPQWLLGAADHVTAYAGRREVAAGLSSRRRSGLVVRDRSAQLKACQPIAGCAITLAL